MGISQVMGYMICGMTTLSALFSSTMMPLFIMGMVVMALAQAEMTPMVEMAKIFGVISVVGVVNGLLAFYSWKGFKSYCISVHVLPGEGGASTL